MPFICSFTDVQLMKNFWDAVQQADEESTDYQVESLVGPCTALIFSYANYKSLHQLHNGRTSYKDEDVRLQRLSLICSMGWVNIESLVGPCPALIFKVSQHLEGRGLTRNKLSQTTGGSKVLS